MVVRLPVSLGWAVIGGRLHRRPAMKRHLVRNAFALAALVVSIPVSAAYQTFVAANGNDANPCSLALPCSTFAAAMKQTAAGGEVIAIDSGSYGPVAITESVSIIAPSG